MCCKPNVSTLASVLSPIVLCSSSSLTLFISNLRGPIFASSSTTAITPIRRPPQLHLLLWGHHLNSLPTFIDLVVAIRDCAYIEYTRRVIIEAPNLIHEVPDIVFRKRERKRTHCLRARLLQKNKKDSELEEKWSPICVRKKGKRRFNSMISRPNLASKKFAGSRLEL